jgi:hypothetical protein
VQQHQSADEIVAAGLDRATVDHVLGRAAEFKRK